MPKSICDFGTETGGAFNSLKQAFKNSYLSATEGSEENTIKLKKIDTIQYLKRCWVKFGMKKY